MRVPDAGTSPVRSRVHIALAAAALALGLLAAVAGEPATSDTATAGEPAVRATATSDSVPSDSITPRQRMSRRGCAW